MAKLGLYNAGNHIRTYSGQWVDVFDPDPDTILIEDIAHHLCFINRFVGALYKPISVAQHSLNCSFMCQDKSLKLDTLLHDATEAYMGDFARPIKKRMKEYVETEEYLFSVIAEKFGLVYPMPEEVHKIDNDMLELEWDMVMIKQDPNFHFGSDNPFEVKRNFLKMFEYYKILQR